MNSESHEFRFAVVHANGSTNVEVGGDLDLASASEFAGRLQLLSDAGPGEVTIDLAKVTFIDSTGLMTVLTAKRRMTDAGQRLKVRNPSRSVCRVLELSGAGHLLDVDLSTLGAVAD